MNLRTQHISDSIALSVIVPIHNGADYLAECLASIECQTLDNIEVLCVDDASTDQSGAIVEQFAAQDSRFKLLSHSQCQGAAASRNHALSEAKGRFVAFMDCDDWYPSETTLERLFTAAVEHQALAVAGSFSQFNMETGELITNFSYDPHLAACFTFTEEGMVDYRSWQGDYGFQRFLFDRAMLLEHNIVFPCIARHEDPVFLVHALLAAKRFYVVPDVVYRYRVGHRELLIHEDAVAQAIDAIIEIIEIAAQENLPTLRHYQYDLLRWYVSEAPIRREYGSWKEIGEIVQRQAGDSLRLRMARIAHLARK